MEFETQTSRTLHDEHMTVRSFLERFGMELTKHQMDQPPEPGNTTIANLLSDLITIVETELTVHFKFEEDQLFPLLDASGAADMTGILLEEHGVILPLAQDLCGQAKSFRRNGFSKEQWGNFRRYGMELVERLTGHIDKEEMGLVPMLDTILDQEQDHTFTGAYAAIR